MSGSDVQGAWVKRVLGIEVGPGARVEDASREIASGMGDMTMAFRKARLGWGTARGKARSGIASLRDGLRKALAADPDFAAMDAHIATLDDIIAGLDGRLEDTLDEAMNATDPAKRQELKKQAVDQVEDYRRFVEGHPVLRKIDDNPFMPAPVFAILSAELGTMAKTLA
jgi:hypothetical protein